MRVEEFMSRKVETVTPETPGADALRLMKARRIRHLVVGSGRRVVGVLSERDLGGRRAGEDLLRSTVGDLMSANVTTVEPSTTTREVARILRGRSIGCVPVMEKGRLVGIVTVSDILDLVSRGSERPVEKSKRWTLRNRGPRRRGGVRPGA